ncbi:MAG: CehA/McbA family metallohydrolase [Bacillota bacterium]
MANWPGAAEGGRPRPPLVVAVLAAALVLAGAAAAARDLNCPLPVPGSEGLCTYFGDLHAHTSYSDGERTPAEAYAFARSPGGLDFLGLSEHAYSLNGRPDLLALYFDAARAATEPGRFVALPGAEWTQSAQGHINVFSWRGFPDRDAVRSYPDLYRWFERSGPLFAQFNHPGFDIQQNWDAFRYDPRADRFIELLEVAGGPFPNNIRYELSYQLALDRGWRVGAAGNSDVHRAQWGTATPTRTAVWAPALTEQALVEAIRARRTYATEDRNAVLLLKSGGAWMGEVLPLRNSAELTVSLWDPDPADAFERLEIVASGGQVVRRVETRGARRANLSLTVPAGRGDAWFYARALQADGDLLISSPIWFEHPSGIRAASVELPGALWIKGRTYRARAVIINGRQEGAQVRLHWRSPGWEGPQEVLDLGPLSARAVEVEWTPATSGVQFLTLEVGPDPANAYPISVPVREKPAGHVLLDEGHNNRYTGLAGEFLARLRKGGVEAQVSTGLFTEETLRGAEVLIIAAPEPGFALTPKTFSDGEIAALRQFVLQGGRLVLAGSLDPGAHGVVQLNRTLQGLGASLRFAAQPLPAGGALAAAGDARAVDLVHGPLAPGRICLRAAASITWNGWPPGAGPSQEGPAVLAAGRPGPRPAVPVAVAERLGAGLIVALAGPTYSPYEYGQRGFDNVAFEDRLVAYLLGGQ